MGVVSYASEARPTESTNIELAEEGATTLPGDPAAVVGDGEPDSTAAASSAGLLPPLPPPFTLAAFLVDAPPPPPLPRFVLAAASRFGPMMMPTSSSSGYQKKLRVIFAVCVGGGRWKKKAFEHSHNHLRARSSGSDIIIRRRSSCLTRPAPLLSALRGVTEAANRVQRAPGRPPPCSLHSGASPSAESAG